MVTLQDSIEIKTKPERIFNWFVHFEENFHAWHPDHVECGWLKGKTFGVGSIPIALSRIDPPVLR